MIFMSNQKSKICFVVAVDITLKYILFSQIQYLQEKGYEVFAVCSPGKWVKELRKKNVFIKEIQIKRYILSPFSDVFSLARLYFYFKQEKFDAIFTFTPKPGLLGQMAAKVAGVPVIINTIFGFYFHENTPLFQRKLFILIEKVAAQFSTFIFFRNTEDFQTAQKEGIIKESQAEYIGDGIDMARFNPERFDVDFKQRKKTAVGIDPSKKVIGIVARLVREKGYIELFEAFKEVLKKFPKTVLLVVGPAELGKKDSLNPGTIKDMGIEKNTVFLGERADVDELFALMDIFTLPSWREGFPHSVMEASAMGLPVITTDVRGCRDAVVDDVTGVIVPPKNSQKLAEAMIHLLSDPQKAVAMGQEGTKKARKDFDERVLFEKVEKKMQVFLR